MTLLETIKSDSLNARKQRDTPVASFLTTLLCEAAAPGLNDGKRDSTDEEVLSVVRKFLKGNSEILAVRPTDETALLEKPLLEAYLPKQLSREQLIGVVKTIAQSNGMEMITPKDMGFLMKSLKEQFSGQYDGKMAKEVIEQLTL